MAQRVAQTSSQPQRVRTPQAASIVAAGVAAKAAAVGPPGVPVTVVGAPAKLAARARRVEFFPVVGTIPERPPAAPRPPAGPMTPPTPLRPPERPPGPPERPAAAAVPHMRTVAATQRPAAAWAADAEPEPPRAPDRPWPSMRGLNRRNKVQSKAQQRWAFAARMPWAHKAAKSGGNFARMPEHKRRRKP